MELSCLRPWSTGVAGFWQFAAGRAQSVGPHCFAASSGRIELEKNDGNFAELGKYGVTSSSYGVNCQLLWKPHTDAHEKSLLHVLIDEQIQRIAPYTVERAVATVAQSWWKDYGIRITLKERRTEGHLVFSLQLPEHSSEETTKLQEEPPAGLLFVVLHLKGFNADQVSQ